MKVRQSRRNEDRRAERGKWAAVLAGAVVVALLSVVFFLVYTRRIDPDYEGTIVDRWADTVESDQGSHPRLRLVVESRDGKRFTVKVDPNVYESARVGMRIKSRSGQIVLIESDKGTAIGK